MNNQEKSLEELQKELVSLGGNINDQRLIARMSKVEDIAFEKYERQKAQSENMANDRPEWAKTVAEYASKGLAWVSVLFTFLFVLGGLFVGTFVLIVAELVAVHDGFAVMDKDRAWLYACAIVLFYIVVLFIHQIVIDRQGIPPRRKLSLKTVFNDFLYFIGAGKNWIVQYKEVPNANNHIDKTVQLSTYTIVAFGLLGRLDEKIGEYSDMSWIDGGKQIITNSSIEEMIGYIGMIIATMALLWGTKWIVYFIYSNFRSVTGGVMMQDFSAASIIVLSPTEMIEAEKKQLIQREIMKMEAKNKA